jgi:hypothetical protein
MEDESMKYEGKLFGHPVYSDKDIPRDEVWFAPFDYTVKTTNAFFAPSPPWYAFKTLPDRNRGYGLSFCRVGCDAETGGHSIKIELEYQMSNERER